MALNAANIHLGPARIFLGVTNPATADPPTWMTHVAGVPATGTEAGYTEGDTIFRVATDKTEILAEQASGPVKVIETMERVEAEFTALERTYDTLRSAFENAKTVNDANRMGWYSGGLNKVVRTQSVMLTSPRPDFAGMYEISLIYKAYNMNGYETAYRKAGASSYRITLRGLNDSTRVLNDQLYQHFIEKT
jgi:hypothetical protein